MVVTYHRLMSVHCCDLQCLSVSWIRNEKKKKTKAISLSKHFIYGSCHSMLIFSTLTNEYLFLFGEYTCTMIARLLFYILTRQALSDTF